MVGLANGLKGIPVFPTNAAFDVEVTGITNDRLGQHPYLKYCLLREDL